MQLLCNDKRTTTISFYLTKLTSSTLIRLTSSILTQEF